MNKYKHGDLVRFTQGRTAIVGFIENLVTAGGVGYNVRLEGSDDTVLVRGDGWVTEKLNNRRQELIAALPIGTYFQAQEGQPPSVRCTGGYKSLGMNATVHRFVDLHDIAEFGDGLTMKIIFTPEEF